METATVYFNQALYEALRNEVANYDEKVGRKVVDAVHSSLVGALGAEDEEVLSESLLVSELLAESIDGLDIAFRIEKDLRIKYDRANLSIAMRFRNPEDRDKPDKKLVEKTALDLAVEAYSMAVKKIDEIKNSKFS